MGRTADRGSPRVRRSRAPARDDVSCAAEAGRELPGRAAGPPARVREPPARRLRRGAGHRRPRRRGHGDRRPALHGLRRRTSARCSAAATAAEPGAAPAACHACARAGSTPQPFHDLVAANLQDQESRRVRARSTTCSPTARCRPTRSAGSCCAVFGVAHAPSRRRCRTGSAPRCRSSSTARTWPRTAARGRVYLPLEDLDRFERAPEPTSDAPRASPSRLRAPGRVRGRAGRRRCSTRALPLLGAPARLGPARGRRLRRRRPGRRRRAAPRRLGRARRTSTAAGNATSLAQARRRLTVRLGDGVRGRAPLDDRVRDLRGDHPDARPATSTTASACCRRPSGPALCAVYALARRIDDIGDGDLPAAAKAHRAGRPARRRCATSTAAATPCWSRWPTRPGATRSRSARSTSWSTACEMDAHRHARYETFDDLVGYCRCVAGSVGRLCLGVFGSRAGPARPRATPTRSGIALQQTNILRDIREDLLNGRVYLPSEDLDAVRLTLELDAHGQPGRPDRRPRRAHRVRGRAGPRLVRPRPAPAAAARPPQRRLRGGDVRHLPPAAGPDRGRPAGRCTTGGCRCRAGRRRRGGRALAGESGR